MASKRPSTTSRSSAAAAAKGKRSATDSAPNPAKRAKLDGWLNLPVEAIPDPIVPSQEIIASDSTFIAHAAPCKSKQEAVRFQTHIREAHTSDPASHEMLAWRVLSLRDGADGTRGPEDFALTQGSDDDGEKWAGEKLLQVLEQTKSIDVAVICSRWFGGSMLGPARFDHIRNTARDAIAKLQTALELDDLKESLLVKDAHIVSLAGPTPTSPGKTGVDPYADLDLAKAKRLLLARDKRIALLEAANAKKAAASTSE